MLRGVVVLTGTKFRCGIAQCGACTVHLDGQVVRSSCCQLAVLAPSRSPPLKALPKSPAASRCRSLARCRCGAVPLCQSGQIMSAVALLKRVPSPSDADIDLAMSGNVCHFATYVRIRAAIHQSATGKPEVLQSIVTAPTTAPARSAS